MYYACNMKTKKVPITVYVTVENHKTITEEAKKRGLSKSLFMLISVSEKIIREKNTTHLV